MKKWTVMLIPHDRGHRRSFELSGTHLGLLAGVFLLLSFAAAFFYQRNQVALDRADDLNRLYHRLEAKMGEIDVEGMVEKRWRDREASLRAEYEQRDAAIIAELSRLYDLEAEVRAITGLPPHSGEVSPAFEGTGGQGGPEGGGGEFMQITDDDMLRPPHVIYGLNGPSADLMLQEIGMRGHSLRQLLSDMNEQADRIARMPSVWPSEDDRSYISSRFGYRKDPFNQRVRHHSGVDIAAWYGTPVVATARGRVVFSGREQFLGNVVQIDHGYGIETWYGHLSSRLVNEGDVVERGDAIGKVGSTGRSTGPHIHYEIHVRGKRVDPHKYLGQ